MVSSDAVPVCMVLPVFNLSEVPPRGEDATNHVPEVRQVCVHRSLIENPDGVLGTRCSFNAHRAGHFDEGDNRYCLKCKDPRDLSFLDDGDEIEQRADDNFQHVCERSRGRFVPKDESASDEELMISPWAPPINTTEVYPQAHAVVRANRLGAHDLYATGKYRNLAQAAGPVADVRGITVSASVVAPAGWP